MLSKKLARVEREACVACGACGNECPRGAIEVKYGCFAQVNSEICIGCGKCEKTCPAGCITIEAREGAR